MPENATSLESLFERAEDYTKTTYELFKLRAIDKSADVVSSLASRLAVLMVVALFIIILNIGMALWIGEMLGKFYFGFFVIAGFYALVAFFLNIFRHQWLKNPLNNSIISQMLKQKEG